MKTNLRLSAIFSVAAAGAQQGFALLGFMLLARMLPEAQLGAWALWLALVAVADMTRQGMVQNGLVRFAATEPSAWPEWLTAAGVLQFAAAVPIGLVLAGTGAAFGLLGGMPDLVALAAWSLPVWLMQSGQRFAEAAQIARQDFRGVFWSNLANGAAQFALTLLFFLKKMPLSVPMLLLFQAIGAVAGLLVTAIFFKKHFAFGKFERARLVELARFGRFVAGTNFCSLLFQRLDTLLVGALLSPAAVALYNVASRLNGLLDLPLNSLSLVLFPGLAANAAASDAGPETRQAAFEQAIRRMLWLQVPLSLALIVTAPWAVRVLAGERYAAAQGLVQILALAGLVKPWGRAFGMWLDANGLPHLNFRMLGLSMAINLIFNLAMIPLWGPMGAALATGLGLFVSIGAGQIWLRKKVFVTEYQPKISLG